MPHESVTETESDLMGRFYSGEVEAFAAIYRQYFGRIAGWARGTGIPHCDAQDIAADTLVRVMLTKDRDASRFRPEWGEFRSWIFAIARNQVISWHRRKNRWEAPTSADGEPMMETVPDSQPDPFAQLAEKERREAFEHCFQWLPELDAQMLRLRCADRLDYREIAELLGVTLTKVTNHLHQAKLALTHCLESFRISRAKGAGK